MDKEVAVTASTGFNLYIKRKLIELGIAAVNIGGCTLHKWAGIGISSDPKVQFKSANKNFKRWINTEVLIIDEISMISGTLFDMLESFARAIRKNQKPFGGNRRNWEKLK